MGVGVSNWRLAQAVSRLGQLGVVSGTALDQVFVRRLADGDRDGHMRRGVEAFPFPEMARRIWQEYFVTGGKPEGSPYPTTPMHQRREPRKLAELCMVANFVEVFLAREGHSNPVGINFLEKVQLPHLASLIKMQSMVNGGLMASMTIRNIDEKLKARLRVQAATHGRSMEDEARDILRAALSAAPVRGRSLVDAIRARIAPLGGIELELSPREAIRESVDLGA